MNPNHIPGPGPAPANVLAPPMYPEPLPTHNIDTPLDVRDEQFVQADTIIDRLRNHQRVENNINAPGAYPTGPAGAAIEAQDRANLAQERLDIENEISTLLSNGDRTELLAQLGAHNDEHRDDVARRQAAGQSVADRTAAANRAFNGVFRAHRNLTRAQSTGTALNGDQVRARNRSEYTTAQASVERAKAARRQRRFLEASAHVEDLDHLIDNMVGGHIAQHEQARQHIAGNISRATQDMRAWGFQESEPYPGFGDSLRNDLYAIAQDLDDPNLLGPRDSARAELLANYGRLRYRLEARGIYNRDPGVAGPVFTEDGGIRINEGQPEEAVIYPNGDSINVGIGDTTRRDVWGQEVTPDQVPTIDLTVPAELPAGAAANVDQYVNRWEESRDPIHGREAHAAVELAIAPLQEQDDDLGNLLEEVRTDRQTINDNIAAINPATTDPQEMARLASLRADLANNTARRNALVGQRRSVRNRLNPLQFTRNLIEAGARLPEPEQVGRARRLARTMLRRNVQTEVESEPLIMQDGSITRANTVLNGYRDTWRIHPDGRSGRVTERMHSGSPVFNPRTGNNDWDEYRNRNGSLHSYF